jgi:hypothetical protein
MLIKDGVNVTGSAWISGFVAPEDGDERLAAHVQVMGGMLAERTLYLKNTSINWVTGGTYNNGNIQLNGLLLLYGTTIAANLELTGGSWLKYSPARPWERHSLEIVATTRSDADSSDGMAKLPDAWNVLVDGAPAIATRSSSSAVRSHWIRLDLPDRGELQTVDVTTIGVAWSPLMTYAKYRVARFKPGAPLEYLSNEATDVHTDANYEATVLTTSLTVAADTIIDSTFTYLLIVKNPYYTGGPSGAMRILDVKASGQSSESGL